MAKDMTSGKTSTTLIMFAIPMLISGLFQQFYNMADSIIVGQYEGLDALSAVGASYPVTMLFIAIATGGGIGCSIVVSQLFGSKKIEKMKTSISTAISSMMIISIIAMVLGIFFCNPLITLLATPENIFADSAKYLSIYIYGVPFLFLYNITNSIYNGLGDSKTPLYLLIFSSILNIILDIIFVKYLKMSVAGVGWATLIAQGLASLISFTLLIYKLSKIKTKNEFKFFDSSMLIHMTKFALPSILQMSTVAIGQLMVQSLINGFNEAVIGGYAAAIKIDSLFKVALITLGNATSSFTAQNYGANKNDRIKEGFRTCIKIALVYSVLSMVAVFFFGDSLIALFDDGKSGTGLIDVGVSYLKIVIMFYPLLSVLMIGNGVLRGAGQITAFTTATFIDLILRVGLSFLLIDVLSYQAVWWAISIGWTVGSIVCMIFYKQQKWVIKKSTI